MAENRGVEKQACQKIKELKKQFKLFKSENNKLVEQVFESLHNLNIRALPMKSTCHFRKHLNFK